MFSICDDLNDETHLLFFFNNSVLLIIFCHCRRYHLQNDELLGSWFFFFAVIPFIPYCLIYLSEGGDYAVVYAAGVLLSIFVAIACFLFVLACYPTEVTVRDLLCCVVTCF